ncbi:MAG: GTPase [Alphaproteobacteria bacterium]|nr:GTPase [Alphaproteobacteria bacterium]
MRLKSFYARTMTEAMQMVRETLGEDAVIVATREEKGGKAVRVTAAIDPGDYSERGGARREPAFETHGNRQPASADTWLQYDDEQDESAVAEEITDAMLRHAVPEDVMDHILSCATVVGFEQPSVALIAAIEHLFHFTPLPLKPQGKALMFVGPPGAGKTLAVAKAAARAAMNGLNVGVISTDTVRAGGLEQLQAFTKLLQIDLGKADSPTSLRERMAMLDNCDQILIDTPGINPFNAEDVKMLARLMGAESMTPILTLPAGIDAEESGEIARVFATIGTGQLLATRLDIARRLGGVLSAAHHGGMSFTDASNTSRVADGFISLNPKILSRLLMPSAFRDEPPARAAGQNRKTGTRQ